MNEPAEDGVASPQGRAARGLADFAARLKAAQCAASDIGEKENTGKCTVTERLGVAWRVSLELVAATAVGSALGFSLDSSLGTRPWFMVLFLLLGSAAGTLNVYRIAQGLDDSIGFGAAKRKREKLSTRHQ